MAEQSQPMSTIEIIRRRKNELLQVLSSAAAQAGTIGAVDAQILIPVSACLAQWEIALQLALRNQRDGIGVEAIGPPSVDPMKPKGKA